MNWVYISSDLWGDRSGGLEGTAARGRQLQKLWDFERVEEMVWTWQ